MGLAPEASPRRFDVLQKRLDELALQKRAVANRASTYQDLASQSSLEQITAVKAQPITERLQYAFSAPSGPELRAGLLEQIADLPPTSAGIANKPFTTKIGIIADLFLYKSFEGLADFQPIYPDNYTQFPDLDILLMVSTWRGVDGVSWKGVTTKTSEKRQKLFEEILPYYRALDIPIVFYSKEDPPNYNHFLPFAQQADYIFTSAAEMVPKYQRDCSEAKSIDVLPFGINPNHHSPIGSQQGEIQRIIPFAGSWFNHKYEDRSRWGNDILDAVVASEGYDLVIFDRNSRLNDERYKFPNRFAHLVTPAIEHQPLLDIQRLVDVSINLNSVSNSSSMFANRAIELQAQGTVVLSNYNVGLNSRYPHVHISNGFTDTLAALNSLNDIQIREIQAAGIRSVFSNDLALMRIAKIIETVGTSAHVADPRVVVVKHGNDDHLDTEIDRQTYRNIVEVIKKETVAEVRQLQEQADIVVHVDTDYEYAPTHVEDLVNAFRYTDARTVEKVPSTVGSALRHMYAEPDNVTRFGAEYIGDVPAHINPRSGYRIDEIGITPRSSSIKLTEPLRGSKKPAILSVVVPIYNNGPHLLHKCIASLRRSSIFDQLEIVLVDDGSTDIATIQAIDKLEQELDWVQVYRFEPGGSGSASRPRNKGLELASCDYVTYLDPDNEALNDAYVKLLHAVIETNVDFAVGDMTRWRGSNNAVRYTKFLQDRLGIEGRVGRGGPQALVDMQFMPISIQALVARTDWLRDTGITQPVGAVGQDSYFFQQMLYYADTFAILKLPAHTYYAQVENSVVNTVNAKFFDKYLPLEKARSQWLREVDLVEDYRSTRMETFFTGWYLRKLADVPADQRPRAIKTIAELGQIYGDHEWQSEEAQKFWTLMVHEATDQQASGDD
ncbi:glycosyltransferase family 2 protein [Enteractinococcus coprophilus]|uniref:Glycosyl transferase family 2 n=1 Tax=Enteractinococcus coprophilus TaxID=1027633 RepID=A0A543AIL0_9MICC|nr:glycosyltransferase family 2 protein [Enteractinococcus coprophilus]TQL72419.1 glycosyl transferase family 2 [Enteractinococcus coprophilus]